MGGHRAVSPRDLPRWGTALLLFPSGTATEPPAAHGDGESSPAASFCPWGTMLMQMAKHDKYYSMHVPVPSRVPHFAELRARGSPGAGHRPSPAPSTGTIGDTNTPSRGDRKREINPNNPCKKYPTSCHREHVSPCREL